MYKEIKKLIKEDKLSFGDNHNTNMHYYLEHNLFKFLDVAKETLTKNKNKNRRPVFENMFCFECGKHLDYYVEDEKLVPSDSVCFQQKEVIIDIPVPSGELIFDDKLEHSEVLFENAHKEKISIQSLKGTIQRTLDFSTEGLAHFFVGNTAPSVLKKDETFFVEGVSMDEEENELPFEKGLEEIGYIDTNFWWTTICDRSIYESIAINKLGEEKGRAMTEEAIENADLVLKVEPGTYRLHYFIISDKGRQLYATLEKTK